jgi:hypothetical protein
MIKFFGLVPISEANAAPSVEYAAPIPPEVQLYVLFSSGIATSSKHPELGEALVQFITPPAAQAFLRARVLTRPDFGGVIGGERTYHKSAHR